MNFLNPLFASFLEVCFGKTLSKIIVHCLVNGEEQASKHTNKNHNFSLVSVCNGFQNQEPDMYPKRIIMVNENKKIFYKGHFIRDILCT